MTDEQWRIYEEEIAELLRLWFQYYIRLAAGRSRIAVRFIPEHKLFCSLYQIIDQHERSERSVEGIQSIIRELTRSLVPP